MFNFVYYFIQLFIIRQISILWKNIEGEQVKMMYDVFDFNEFEGL